MPENSEEANGMSIDAYVEEARGRWIRGGGRPEDFDVYERAIRTNTEPWTRPLNAAAETAIAKAAGR